MSQPTESNMRVMPGRGRACLIGSGSAWSVLWSTHAPRMVVLTAFVCSITPSPATVGDGRRPEWKAPTSCSAMTCVATRPRADTSGSWCESVDDVELTREAFPTGTIQVCEWPEGDTSHYAVRDGADRLLVAGSLFAVDSSRLTHVADSVRDYLARKFGGGVDCRNDLAASQPRGRLQFWRWHRQGQTILLRIRQEPPLPFVPTRTGTISIEWQRRTVSCNDFIGMPLRID